MKKLIQTINMCFSMFTIFSLPCKEWDETLRTDMLYFFPILGVYLSIIYFIIFHLSFFICNEYNIYLIVLCMSIFPFVASGFIHLDGFMDVSDALGSCGDKEKILKILKDSHVGSFAVINVIILFIIESACMFGVYKKILGMDIIDRILIILCITSVLIISRTMSSIELTKMRVIHQSEYNSKNNSKDIIDNNKIDLLKSMIIKKMPYIVFILTIIVNCIIIYFLSSDNIFLKNLSTHSKSISRGIYFLRLFLTIIFVTISHLSVAFKCKKRFGGINGDVSGYSICISECVGLVPTLFI